MSDLTQTRDHARSMVKTEPNPPAPQPDVAVDVARRA